MASITKTLNRNEAVTHKPPLDLIAIYPAIADIGDARLRLGVIDVFEELWQASDWMDLADLPTSGEIAHPNLPHTQCVVNMALAVADALTAHHGTRIDRDMLI